MKDKNEKINQYSLYVLCYVYTYRITVNESLKINLNLRGLYRNKRQQIFYYLFLLDRNTLIIRMFEFTVKL